MSVKAVELVVVPLVFEHGRNYRIKCYTSSVRITGHGVDDDAWGRSWAIGERSHIGTSRSNRVNDLHVSIPLVDSPVEPPTDVPAVAEDIHVSLAWGDRVTARRSTTDDTCTFALHFGDREATTWQALKGASLWFGSDADGRLAFIVGSCPSRRPTSVSLTFPADREYKAALYGDISFNLRASALPAILGRLTEREPLDEEQQPALHEQGLDRDDEDEDGGEGSVDLESHEGDANIAADIGGVFARLDFPGAQTFGTVEVPQDAERVDSVTVTSAWTTSVSLHVDRSIGGAAAVSIGFGDAHPSRWVELSKDGPWVGISDDGDLAAMVLSDVRWDSDFWDMDRHSPERFEATMAEEEAAQDRALSKVDFPVYGLAGDWGRERSIRVETEPTPRSVSVELRYGTVEDPQLPYVEVTTTNERWRVAELRLRRGKPGEDAFESVEWLSHLTGLPVEGGHSSRAAVAERFAEGRRQEQELSERPWAEHQLIVDGQPVIFLLLAHKHGWVAEGVVGDLAVDVKVLNLAPEDVRLETVENMLPYIEGRKAEVMQMQQQWSSVEEDRTWMGEGRASGSTAGYEPPFEGFHAPMAARNESPSGPRSPRYPRPDQRTGDGGARRS